MPFSQSSQISTIVQYFEQLNPISLLDVGVGMGLLMLGPVGALWLIVSSLSKMRALKP